jgi:hypothetical protein
VATCWTTVTRFPTGLRMYVFSATTCRWAVGPRHLSSQYCRALLEAVKWPDENTFSFEVQSAEYNSIPPIRFHGTVHRQTKSDFLPYKGHVRSCLILLTILTVNSSCPLITREFHRNQFPACLLLKTENTSTMLIKLGQDRVVNDSAIVSVTGTDLSTQHN